MPGSNPASCTAFHGTKRLASGALPDVALAAKQLLDRDPHAQVLLFDDLTSELIEVDFRGAPADVAKRVETPAVEEPRRPGRPKLGVVAREVTLLPRHWEWLATQPGGGSVALRKLVEEARLRNGGRDRRGEGQELAHKFMCGKGGQEGGRGGRGRGVCRGRRN